MQTANRYIYIGFLCVCILCACVSLWAEWIRVYIYKYLEKMRNHSCRVFEIQ